MLTTTLEFSSSACRLRYGRSGFESADFFRLQAKPNDYACELMLRVNWCLRWLSHASRTLLASRVTVTSWRQLFAVASPFPTLPRWWRSRDVGCDATTASAAVRAVPPSAATQVSRVCFQGQTMTSVREMHRVWNLSQILCIMWRHTTASRGGPSRAMSKSSVCLARILMDKKIMSYVEVHYFAWEVLFCIFQKRTSVLRRSWTAKRRTCVASCEQTVCVPAIASPTQLSLRAETIKQYYFLCCIETKVFVCDFYLFRGWSFFGKV